MEKKQNVTQPDALQREWTRLVAQAWADPDFRKRLEKNPRAVLKERGVDVPGDVDLHVIDKPIEMEGIEQAVRPMNMAVAAGFAAPPMPAPQPNAPFSVAGAGPDYYSGGYADPAFEAYAAADPTLEAARWKVGLCIQSRATIGACAHFKWGAAQPQPMQQPFPTQQQFAPPQYPLPAPPYGTPQQPPTAAWGGAETLPYYGGDIYSGAVDPTLDARRIKIGLCPNVNLTGGVCAYFHSGTGQPQPTQQFMPPQYPMPASPYATPQQPPTSASGGDIYSAGAPQSAAPSAPQQLNIGWAATVPTTCFSGGAASQGFVPGVPQPGNPQYHIQPSPGRQYRPAMPGSA